MKDTMWSEGWRRLRARRSAVLALAVLALVALAAILVPWLSPYDYATPAWTRIFTPPTLRAGQIFGTDALGRDLLVRVMWGTELEPYICGAGFASAKT